MFGIWWPKVIEMQQWIMKKRSLKLSKCQINMLESTLNIIQLKCNLNKLNLHGFTGCAITYLTKARPVLSWDQALLLVNGFFGNRANRKILYLMQYVHTWNTLTNKHCCMSLGRLPLFHDFRLVNVRQLHSMQRKMQHQHLAKRWWCNHLFVLTFHESTDLALNTRAFSDNSRPHTVHISWNNKSIPRMWPDFPKIPAIH